MHESQMHAGGDFVDLGVVSRLYDGEGPGRRRDHADRRRLGVLVLGKRMHRGRRESDANQSFGFNAR